MIAHLNTKSLYEGNKFTLTIIDTHSIVSVSSLLNIIPAPGPGFTGMQPFLTDPVRHSLLLSVLQPPRQARPQVLEISQGEEIVSNIQILNFYSICQAM